MKRRFYTQVYLGLLITAVLCVELTFVALVGESALRDSTAGQLPPLGRAQLFVLIVLVSIAIGAVPMARRTTRRLEALQTGVEKLATGDLATRVEVGGEDEIADVATSFNRAAERIEQLVGAQQRMLASASHEFRTPLTHIRATLGLLADEVAEAGEGSASFMEPGEREKLIAAAEADIEELDSLIDDLLLTSRLSSGGRPSQVEEVELHEAFSEGLERFEISLGGDPTTIRGDRRALQRMLRNLIQNAKRHGRGMSLELGLEPLPANEGVRLVVEDRGPGVAEEERERIFEPFYRSAGHDESTDSGVGLGLALVREIAHFHGGEARCLPREGGGTRFEVDLAGRARPDRLAT